MASPSLGVASASSSAAGTGGAPLLSSSPFVALGSSSFFGVRFRFFDGCAAGGLGSAVSAPFDPACSDAFWVERVAGAGCVANFRFRASFRLVSAPPPRRWSVGSLAGMVDVASEGPVELRCLGGSSAGWSRVERLGVRVVWMTWVERAAGTGLGSFREWMLDVCLSSSSLVH